MGGPVGIEPSISISLDSLSTLSQLPTQPPCCYFESVELKWGNGIESNCVGLVGSQKLDHITISMVRQFEALGSIIENDEKIEGDVN